MKSKNRYLLKVANSRNEIRVKEYKVLGSAWNAYRRFTSSFFVDFIDSVSVVQTKSSKGLKEEILFAYRKEGNYHFSAEEQARLENIKLTNRIDNRFILGAHKLK